jgi:DNA-binding SARP family transcriptional activator/tetratricopeptide (TPR) repeat protein
VLVFSLLGSLEVRGPGGGLVPVGRHKQRALLAMLLLRTGTVVRLDEIIEALWDGRPPSSARANVYSYVSGLRALLDQVAPADRPRPVTAPGGYRLDLLPGECDVAVFEALAAGGRRALDEGRPAQAADQLGRALGLWRGPALEDLTGFDWTVEFTARLTEARLVAMEDHAEARLALGEQSEDSSTQAWTDSRHASTQAWTDSRRSLAADLAAATAEHPLRERFWELYLRTLQQGGSRARALGAYEDLRAVLRAELGVEPSPALRKLHREILDDTTVVPRARPAPALLPPAVADFTGRREELRMLREVLAPGAAPAGLTVAGVTGMAGIGKTTLAVQAAHAVAAAYPDGQVYVNLAGAGSAPLDPADVLGRFLRALGVPSRAVPPDPEERVELYRTLLAGRRVLVVLDNAAAEGQVRPLLPGASSCAVLITSRSRLSGLESARWTELEVLPAEEATRLLAQVVRDARVGDQPADAAAIVHMCGGLPLAVRIAGARLTSRPGWTLAHLVALLRDEQRRLDRLGIGDLQVRASLALSYDGLPSPARRLFRLLGTLDVPDFPGWLAGVLAQGSPDRAAQDLDLLVDAHLLAVVGTDPVGQIRYRFHDLVRLFARDRAVAQESPADLDDALRRGFGAWLAVAEQLERRVPGPCFAPIAGFAPRPPVDQALAELAGADPVGWFEAEQVAMRAVIRQACGAGHDEVAFDLAQRMEKYFDVRGMFGEWEASNRLVMAACRATGNLRGEAVMLRGLVDVTTWVTTDHTTEAMTRSHADAIRLQDMFRRADELGGMADAAVMRSWSLTAMGRHEEAIDAANDSLGWAGKAAHLGGQARAHVALAVALGESDRLRPAVEHLYQALACARELGNPRYEATVLQFLGIGHSEAGQLDLGGEFLRESLEISRRHKDAYTEVLTMIALARLHLRRGDGGAAPAAEAALALAREYRMTHHVADSLGILGEIELNAGRPVQAAAYLRDSVAMWRTRGWLRFQAAALTLLGRALSTLDREAAGAALREAGELFTRAGDTARAGDAERLLRELQTGLHPGV